MNIDKLKNYKHFRPYVLVVLADVLFFAFFSPVGSTWVILPALVLVIITIWLGVRLLMHGISQLLPLKSSTQKRLTRLLVIAIGLVVALQSIGQLTAKDVLTIVPLVAVLYFYMAYTGTTSAER